MKISIHTGRPGCPTGDLFGIFLEDLNHAVDGGLYPELVQNRSFEFSPVDHPDYHSLTAWEPVGNVKLWVLYGGSVSDKNPHYLSIDIQDPEGPNGVVNTGFAGGMPLEEGEKYRFFFYAKREQDLNRKVSVLLVDAKDNTLAEENFCLTTAWNKYECVLTPSADARGKLKILAEGRGKVYIDMVSLMPEDTYHGLPFRKDLAEKLEALKPRFLRFPGGCLTHDGALDIDARDAMYRWKNTLGPVENRPARRNNWNYNQTLGLGFYEYFVLAEAIGAKPVPVISVGYDPHHHREAPIDQMWPWIEDALNLIEFANGPEESQWGSVRAVMGHPEPFHMEYLALGNEEVGEAFHDRCKIVMDAVRRKYPQIRIIGTAGPFCSGGEFDRGWKHARHTGAEIVDEHYYMAPEWFLNHTDRYDSYDREGPKVFLGEFASKGNTWYNALSEAAYMTSLEQNADVVAMACYAPLLCNAHYVNWQPDLIWFNENQVVETPNYKVQKLFMHHQGPETVPTEVEAEPISLSGDDSLSGDIALGAAGAIVEYTDIIARNLDTGEIRTYQDVALSPGHPFKRLDTLHWSRYILRLKAKKHSGVQGFQIYFGWRSQKDHMEWTIGGWQNQDSILTEVTNGLGSDLTQCLQTVSKGHEYELSVRVDGREVIAELDGRELHQLPVRPRQMMPLYASAQREGKEWILKVVNATETEQKSEVAFDTLIHLAGPRIQARAEKDAVSTFEKPYAVTTETSDFKMQSGDILSFPPYSLTIFRLKEQFLQH